MLSNLCRWKYHPFIYGKLFFSLFRSKILRPISNSLNDRDSSMEAKFCPVTQQLQYFAVPLDQKSTSEMITKAWHNMVYDSSWELWVVYLKAFQPWWFHFSPYTLRYCKSKHQDVFTTASLQIDPDVESNAGMPSCTIYHHLPSVPCKELNSSIPEWIS